MFNKKADSKSINLLEPVNQGSNFLEGSFTWLTTVGKWALIVVEIVVLGVFFSRFILDKKNNDLADDINKQVAVLENDIWKQNAAKYQNLQHLFSDIKTVESKQKLNSTRVSELLSTIPLTLNVESFNFSGSRVMIALKTTSFGALKDYEESLKNNMYYKDVKFNITKTRDELEVNISFLIKSEDELQYVKE
jgi:Tfp pilus assembly protein PilN